MSDVVIPQSAFVPCPQIGFQNRRVTKCAGCEHYRGLVEVMRAEDVQFEQRYRVVCAHAISRRMVSIEVEDAGA